MAYIKNTWVDQEVERPKTYEMVNNSDGSVTLVDSFGLVSELGTPVNANNMNHIEDGIEDHEERITELEEGGAGMGLPIGTIFQAIRTDIPEGCLRLDGTEFTTGFEGFVTNYLATGKIISKSLEEWQTEYTMTNGNVGFFGYEEATGAFKTPCIQAGTFLAQAVVSGEFGSFLASSLKSHTHTQAAHTHTRGDMNITGTVGNATAGFGLNWTGDIMTSGSFYRSKVSNCTLGGSGGVKADVATQIAFDASHTWTGSTSSAQPTINATGGSDTYPKHIRYPFFVVVSDVAAEEPSQATWDNFVGNLDGKANKSDVVSKLGDTMTGNLIIKKGDGTTPITEYHRTDINIGDTPSTATNLGGMFCHAGVTPVAAIQARIETVSGKSCNTIQLIAKNPDNTGWGNGAYLMTRADGQSFFEFPKCTAKATTTSSAANNKVAVITQNYVNGTSWYRVWSDGWIEQGGYAAYTASTVTLLKNYSNTNYCITTQGAYTGSTGTATIVSTGNKTTSKFEVFRQSYSAGGYYWRACGY